MFIAFQFESISFENFFSLRTKFSFHFLLGFYIIHIRIYNRLLTAVEFFFSHSLQLKLDWFDIDRCDIQFADHAIGTQNYWNILFVGFDSNMK